MILRRGVMTNRALPVSVAAEFQVLAVFYRRPVQLEAVSKGNPQVSELPV